MPSQHSKTVGSSSVAKLIACPGNYALSKQAPPDTSSSYADEGTMLHKVFELVLTEDADPKAMIGTAPDPELPDNILTEELYHEIVVPGLDYLDDVAREFGTFDYECERQVFYPGIPGAFGTLDIIGTNDKYSFIIDWKCGRGVPVDAKGNKQLRYGAWAGAHTDGVKDMFSRDKKIVLVIIQPVSPAEPFTHEVIDFADLESFNAEVLAAWKLAQQKDAPLQIGDHCQFCRAKLICPEQRKGVDLGLTKVNQSPTIPELPDLIALCDQLEPWIKAVRKAAHEALERGETVPGYKLVPKRATRQWTDEDEAFKRMSAKRLKKAETRIEKNISPAQAEKLFKRKGLDWETMSDLVVAISSGNTMAPDSDKRPAVSGQRQGVNLALPEKE